MTHTLLELDAERDIIQEAEGFLNVSTEEYFGQIMRHPEKYNLLHLVICSAV